MLLAEPKLSVAQRKKLKDKMLLEKFGSDLISLPYKESEQIIHEDVIQDLIDQDVLKELICTLLNIIFGLLFADNKTNEKNLRKFIFRYN